MKEPASAAQSVTRARRAVEQLEEGAQHAMREPPYDASVHVVGRKRELVPLEAIWKRGVPIPAGEGRPELRVDLVVKATDVDPEFCAELGRLAPTGPGNPDPLVAVEGLTVTRVRPTAGGHTQLTLKKRLDVLDAIAFGRGDLATVLHEGDRLDVVSRVATRRYVGFESIQLEIVDVAPEGAQPATATSSAGEPAPSRVP